MSKVNSQKLHPAFLAEQLHGKPITPQKAEDISTVSLLEALRKKSSPSSAVPPHTLNAEALDHEHDQQHQTDQACKRLLAHSKLSRPDIGGRLTLFGFRN